MLIVWLGLAELAWISYWLVRRPEEALAFRAIVALWIVAMLVWTGLVIKLGTAGFFLRHTRRLSNLVGLALVMGVTALVFSTLPTAREGFLLAAAHATNTELAAIHILRLLAIGAGIKYLQGELPRHFVVLGALPDFLFGVSAVAVTMLAAGGGVSRDFLIAWHAVGFSLFTGAGVSMFFSVPSPLRILHSTPDASIVFRFPMLLAPNVTVPLFMFAHAIALVKWWAS